MKQFKLDTTQAVQLQITNDAFFYLLAEEEPLDDANLDEAEEILAMFPNGFIIDENWKAVEESDLIEATFIPYVADNADYDEYFNLTSHTQLQIKWLDASNIRVWRYSDLTNTRELQGDFKVYTNNHGLKCFHTGNQDKPFTTGKQSLFFIKHFKKK